MVDAEGNPEQVPYDYFEPKYFHPHLKLFSLPKKVPANVAEEINQSFELFFCSPSSAVNHIRIALENLLTHMKVIRYYRYKKGKHRSRVPLNERIKKLPRRYDNLKELFLAIKWLGNEGSHGDTITVDAVADAYDFMDEALHELFERKRELVMKSAKKIFKKLPCLGLKLRHNILFFVFQHFN